MSHDYSAVGTGSDMNIFASVAIAAEAAPTAAPRAGSYRRLRRLMAARRPLVDAFSPG